MSKHTELAGRVALVTGATRQAGIGAAIARELVAAGAAVFIAHFRDYDQRQTWGIAPGEPASILATLGASAAGTEIDLSAPSAAVELFERAISRFGRVDTALCFAERSARGETAGMERVDGDAAVHGIRQSRTQIFFLQVAHTSVGVDDAIRLGRCRPHRRHWPALARLVGLANPE